MEKPVWRERGVRKPKTNSIMNGKANLERERGVKVYRERKSQSGKRKRSDQ